MTKSCFFTDIRALPNRVHYATFRNVPCRESSPTCTVTEFGFFKIWEEIFVETADGPERGWTGSGSGSRFLRRIALKRARESGDFERRLDVFVMAIRLNSERHHNGTVQICGLL